MTHQVFFVSLPYFSGVYIYILGSCPCVATASKICW
jgi:hypothetical protein